MRRPTTALPMEREHRLILENVAAATPETERDHRSVRCAQALLLASRGLANTRIATEVGVSPTTVKSWRERFEEEGLNALSGIRPGRGRKKGVITRDKVAEILHVTRFELPPHGKPRWTCRTLAKATNVSSSTVQRIWADHGIDPSDP